MRVVLQRVRRARVLVESDVAGAIDGGLLILLGVAPSDSTDQARWMADKVVGLRIFADEDGKMNRDVREVGGGILVVSQFTLFGDCRKGRRPSFVHAMAPAPAEVAYDRFVTLARQTGVPVETGRFRADMQVELVNDGPVTLLVDSKRLF